MRPSPADRMPPAELCAIRALVSPPGRTLTWEEFGQLFGVCGRTLRRYARGETKRGVPYTVAQEARRLKIEHLARR